MHCRYSSADEEDIMTTLNRMETQYSSMFNEDSNRAGSDGDSEEDGEVKAIYFLCLFGINGVNVQS